MRNWRGLTISILLLSAIVLITQSAFAADRSVNATNASIITSTDVKELISFVESAEAYVKDNGKEKALKEFNNKTGPFVKGDLYIFAFDLNGTCLANMAKPEWIGVNKLNKTDANGVLFTKNAINYVRNNDGLYYLVFPNPAHNNRSELKLSYAKKVDDNWFLGSGQYLSNVSPSFDQREKEELMDYMNDALEFARKSGREKAIEIFNDPKGNFTRNDRYIFAYDYNGTCLALPYQHDAVGKHRLDLQDLNGIYLNRQAIDLARSGNGFFYYFYPDPSRNMTPTLKLSYVTDVDGTWFFGSGIYAKGNETS